MFERRQKRRLAGHVILVHYKNIEQNFIDAACRRLYGSPFIIPIIDTLPIAQTPKKKQRIKIKAQFPGSSKEHAKPISVTEDRVCAASAVDLKELKVDNISG